MNLLTKEDMDYLFECPFCTTKYTLPEREPKVLNCGHTFCLVCLTDEIKYTQLCPECIRPVAEPISQYPTNFVLVNKENINDTSKFQLDKEISMVQIQIEDQVKCITESMGALEHQRYQLECLSKTMKQCENIEIGECELRESIEEIKTTLKKIDLVCNSRLKFQVKADFTLGSINKKKFIMRIVNQIYQKKLIYAFNSQWYNEKIYWGRLSYEEGKLCIHSFTTEVPPVPSLFVSLSDLKKCMCYSKFETFIDYGDEKHIYHILAPPFKSTLNFIKLCTGEDGSSFKQLTLRSKPSDTSYCIFNIEDHKPKTGILNDYEFLQYENIKFYQHKDLGSSLAWYVIMGERECSIETMIPPPCQETNIVAAGTGIRIDKLNNNTEQNSECPDSTQITSQAVIVKDCGIYIKLPI